MHLGNWSNGTLKRRGYKLLIQNYEKATGLRHRQKQMSNRALQLKNIYIVRKILLARTGVGRNKRHGFKASKRFWEEQSQVLVRLSIALPVIAHYPHIAACLLTMCWFYMFGRGDQKWRYWQTVIHHRLISWILCSNMWLLIHQPWWVRWIQVAKKRSRALQTMSSVQTHHPAPQVAASGPQVEEQSQQPPVLLRGERVLGWSPTASPKLRLVTLCRA